MRFKPHSKEYTNYLRSSDWAIKRKFALFDARYKCKYCWCISPLAVHHKTYDRLGHERTDDLEVLCPDHHKEADVMRAAETAIRAAQRREERRFVGWCEKVYGEGWEFRINIEDAYDRFYRWLDSRPDYE